MPVKFDWDLDPGSTESFFSLEGSQPEDLRFYSMGAGSMDEYYKKSGVDFLEPPPVEGELYASPGTSPSPVPNDDMWKKFGIVDMTEALDEEVSEMFDLTSVSWSSPMPADSREIRNHDCMWAGHCISEKHEMNSQKSVKCVNLLPVKKRDEEGAAPVAVVAAAPGGAAGTDAGGGGGDGGGGGGGGKPCGRLVAPTHARSLLLPTRIVAATPQQQQQQQQKRAAAVGVRTAGSVRATRRRRLDSGGESPRPETPQSLSDNEDLNLDLPDMRTVEDFVVDAFGYNFVNEIAQNVAGSEDESCDDLGMYLFGETTGKSSPVSVGHAFGSKKQQQNQDQQQRTIKQEVPVSRHYTAHSFFSDHCYHLNKNARMDNLGVQTPSDSEEEIDVETVYGDSKKPASRSSSSGAVLPTNPSLSDRQHLQLTVATAISKKEARKQSARTATVPSRYHADDRTVKSRTIPCKRKYSVRGEGRRTAGAKRGCGGGSGAQYDDYSDYVTKSVKRKKYQYQRHYKSGKGRKPGRSQRSSGRIAAGGSSDSEVDSIERRTIHNSMERQRRIDLRNSFEELRKLIPHTAGNEKAAKVVILSYGAEFCRSLTLEDSELTRKKAELRRQQEMLMARVSQLRRSLAAQR